jgi:hypothetical protein
MEGKKKKDSREGLSVLEEFILTKVGLDNNYRRKGKRRC